MTNKRIMIRLLAGAFAFCICFPSSFAQVEKIMYEGTTFGFASYQLKDTYLSPFIFKGWGGRIINERVTILQPRFSRQQIIGVDIATTKNPAENVNDFGTFVDYSLAYHYHFFHENAFNVLAGATAHIMGGFIYNTRNGNNPLSAKVDINLGLSFMALYTFHVSNHPVSLRYQGVLPFSGIFFAPPYGASYYEMFNEGNTSNIIAFNSFHNKFSVKNYVTVDIPVSTSTMRLGYLFSYYTTDVKDIQTRIFSNTFMIGWVKRFYFK
ncbi:hypothetical protein FACS189435_0480 [Bacteroidia bacterium]|nr:hypothetical protein FACS189435_0480 [Bacteroidia bacterium]